MVKAPMYVDRNLREAYGEANKGRTVAPLPHYFVINLPRGYSAYRMRWPRRYIMLTIRNFMTNIFRYKGTVENDITELVKGYFHKGERALAGDSSYVGPDQTFQPGDSAIWLPNIGHPPNGVCPWCMWISNTFKGGASPKILYDLAMDPRHTTLHRNSSVHNLGTNCHCRIVKMDRLGKLPEGAMMGGEPTGTDVTRLPDMTEAIKRLLIAFGKSMFLLSRDEAKKKVDEEKAAFEVRIAAERLEAT